MNSTLQELAAAGTAVIADVMDAEGRTPTVLDNQIVSFVASGAGFAGPAYTISGESHRWSGSDRAKLAAIDGMTPGVVGVWAGNDIRGVCCFGDHREPPLLPQ
jgi:4-hydroxy-4-methyl-2-oxoglutarate aldolase